MQLHDLSDVLAAPGPFVSVLVDATSDVEQAAAKYDAEWKAILQRLDEQGVRRDVVDALSGARGSHAEGESRLVVATDDGQVRLSEPLALRPAQSSIDLGALPNLLPIVQELTAQVPHVVVLADRRGADISAFYDQSTQAGEMTVKGRRLHLTKISSGGWSQSRYLHNVENNWQAVAADIAQAVALLAGQIGAALIVGAGDERELQLVRDALPTEWQPLWVQVDGGRGHDGSRGLVQRRVAAAVSTHVAHATMTLLADYAQELGQDKRAVDGLVDVVEALRQGQVQTLLLTTDPDEHSTLWFGEQPLTLGTSREDVITLGAREPAQGPLLAVLLRAALATGADVQVVPHQSEQAPFSGLGALLRYAGST